MYRQIERKVAERKNLKMMMKIISITFPKQIQSQ